MAEGIMKKFFGTGTYVQSAGCYNDLEIDAPVQEARSRSDNLAEVT